MPTKSLEGNRSPPTSSPKKIQISEERELKFFENIPMNTGKITAAQTKSAIKNKYRTLIFCAATNIAGGINSIVIHLEAGSKRLLVSVFCLYLDRSVTIVLAIPFNNVSILLMTKMTARIKVVKIIQLGMIVVKYTNIATDAFYEVIIFSGTANAIIPKIPVKKIIGSTIRLDIEKPLIKLLRFFALYTRCQVA